MLSDERDEFEFPGGPHDPPPDLIGAEPDASSEAVTPPVDPQTTIRLLQNRVTELEKSVWQHQGVINGLQESLQAREQQAAQHMQALRAREDQLHQSIAKGRALADQLHQLREERDEAGRVLTLERQRLDQQRRELRALRRQLAEQTPAETSEQACDPEEPVVAIDALVTNPPAEPPTTGARSLAPRTAGLIAIGVALLATAALLGATWLTHTPRYRVTGIISVDPPDAEVLARCEQTAWTPGISATNKTWQTRPHREQGILALSLEASDPKTGAAEVDRVGQAILAAEGVPSTAPATAPAELRDRLLARIEDLSRELATTPQPSTAPSTTTTVALLDSLGKIQKERARIAGEVQELSARIAARPATETGLVLDPSQIRQAEGEVKKLQADLAALQHRQQRLVELLAELLEPGLQRLDILHKALGQGVNLVSELLQQRHDEEVQGQLENVRQALTRWSDATRTFMDTWTSRRMEVRSSLAQADGIVVQASIEEASHQYLDQTAGIQADFEQALAAIPQGGEEPTKRIVLHRQLSQRFQPLLDAVRGAQSAAQSVILGENSQLSAVVQTVSSLQTRIQEQRADVEHELRQQLLADLRKRHEEEVARALAERDRLLAQDRELETTLSRALAEALAAMAEYQKHQETLTAYVDVVQRRATLLDQLRAATESSAQPAEGPVMRYIPAQSVELVGPLRPRLMRTLLLSAGPISACILAGVILWFVLSWYRSGQVMEVFARQLEEAAREKGRE